MAASEDKGGPNVVTLLAAVATAIGTLGWVAFIGGAMLWINFSRANLPSAEAVAKVPTPVMVATGAEFVVWAVLAALVTVAVLFVFDDWIQSRIDKLRAGRFEPILRGLLPAVLVMGTAIGFAFLIDLGYGHIPWFWGVFWVCVAALVAGVVAAMLYSSTGRFSVIGIFAVIAVPLAMGIAMYYRAQAAPRVEPVALLGSDGTPFVGFFIAETTDRDYVGTFDESTPDPCALLHKNGCAPGPVEGVTAPARLLSLPRNDVQNLTVGPRTPLYAEDALTDPTRPQTAREWAAGAALRLCETASAAKQRAEANAPPEAGTTAAAALPPTCSDEDIQHLRDFDQNERSAVKAAASD